MKLKYIFLLPTVFILLFSLPLFVAILGSDNEVENKSSVDYEQAGANLSAEVLTHLSTVEKYCEEYGISDYIAYILAIMEVESGGKVIDVMQSSESLGMAPNFLNTDASIKQGCAYFASLLETATQQGCDIDTVIQAYNYGGSFISYVSRNGKQYTFELAESFSQSRSGGVKVTYPNPIAIAKNGGWKYRYGNMFYVSLVSYHLSFTSMSFDDATVQTIMNEALKYEGWTYVFGGSSPSTSFDCSGLTQWCFNQAGITLPRTAQMQYDAMQHISISEAKAGDLVFFQGTYSAGTYITHVGIYVDDMQMYHAGNPIGYTDLTTTYWQQHIVCAGRIIEK